MPVIPHCPNLFEDRQTLYQFLFDCQKSSIKTDRDTIVSISLKIQPLDPLAVMQAIAQPDRLSFYMEKGCQNEAIAAIDCAIHLTIEGPNRFSRARDFIRSCLANTITTGDLHLPFSGPHFFCSFTFFDRNQSEYSTFPAATIFLPRWQIARQKNNCTLVLNLLINNRINLQELSEHLWYNIQNLKSSNFRLLQLSDFKLINPKKQAISETDKFKSAVLSALKSIRANQFSKIVLAHAIDVISQAPFQIFHSLNNLRKRHPDCYIFATSNGKGTHFIGASPERLISLRDRQLATDALAGSAPRGKTAEEDATLANRLLNSEKELHEHRVVIDFIIQRLSQLNLTPQMSPSVLLLQLSNIQHLWTPIQALVPADVHILEILAELHPTPAVAGAPRDIACQEIRRYETFERSLYAAPLGWVDRLGNGEFIVGIRSAMIDGDRARLYAGAGIVAGSDPDKELAEIQLKFQALLKALV